MNWNIICALIFGGVIGMLIGSAISYPRGWRAGVSWSQARIFGG